VQVEGSVSIVRRVGNGEVGPLALGFVPSASNNILPTILRAFPERYPEVELFLHEMKPDALVQRMHDRRIDVSFFYLPFHDAALMFRPVLREPLVAALPEAHPLAGEPEVDLGASLGVVGEVTGRGEEPEGKGSLRLSAVQLAAGPGRGSLPQGEGLPEPHDQLAGVHHARRAPGAPRRAGRP
jgi:hypothetical protein